MPTCKSCNTKLLRTDAFCGACGEPVPGAKPVVPLPLQSRPSGVQPAPERRSGTFSPQPQGQAPAAAVVALSEPEEQDPRAAEPNQTAIREKDQSEPAPVLPLRRRKDGASTLSDEPGAEPSEPSQETAPQEPSASFAERDTSLPNMPVPAGPPILASDLLRQQMRPQTPGDRSLRIVTVALSSVGLIGAAATGGAHALTFVSATLLIGMAILALTPMSYRARAFALLAAGSVTTGVALWQQTIHGLAPEGIILAAATILLSGALLFRAYYRGARLSRFAVALGVTALGVWFVASGGHESLVRLEGHWQSWAPATTHMAFGLLALLSLMAFMESSTRGGAHVWAVSLFVLYGVHITLLIAGELWPAAAGEAAISGPTVAALIAGVAATIVAGLALAQVFVVAYQASSSRPKSVD